MEPPIHGGGHEEATSDADTDSKSKRKSATARQNEISQAQPVGDQNLPSSPPAQRNNPSAEHELTKVRSGRLGTDPELARTKSGRPSTTNAAAPSALKGRPSGSTNVVAATGGQSSPIGTQPSSPSHLALANPRPKPSSPKGNRTSRYNLRSCFGSPATKSSSSGTKVRSSSQTTASQARKQTSQPRVVPVSADPAKPLVPREETLTTAPTVQDSTTNLVLATAIAVEAPPPGASADSAKEPTEALPAIPRSPSCRCSITVVQAETGQPLPLDPGDPTSMSKAEKDAGISSSQEALNAQTAELIAAVKLADEEHHETPPEPSLEPSSSEARQAAAGVSPIRGLRPGSQITGQRRRRSETEGEDPRPRATGTSSPQDRPSSSINPNYGPGGSSHSRRAAYGEHRRLLPRAARHVNDSGIGRLFDAILGRPVDHHTEERPRSRPPNRYDLRPPRNARNPTSASTSSAYANQVRSRSDDDEQNQARRDLALNNPPQTSSSVRAQTYSEPLNPPGETSNRGQKYANLTEISNRDKEDPANIASGSGTQATEYDTFVDARAALDLKQQQRVSKLLDSDFTWKKKDPYRPVVERTKDPRRRGQPDPSFIPRPGDIIIRARKRAGLRLTDFYYYDDENYMEEGDQILRAKFEYLPPMDKMYLWCRLYVFRAVDGTYTFLDQTTETVGNFRTVDPADAKTFKKPSNFMGT